MTWQPLSVRQGRRQPEGPYEGLPDHLKPHVLAWILTGLRSDRNFGRTAALELKRSSEKGPVAAVYSAASEDDDFCLDVLDYLLHQEEVFVDDDDLELMLQQGGSVWTISPDRTALERRVEATVRQAVEVATSPADQASAELAEAWSKVYGRHPDASDAWDHAIKAVEELAIPVVVPKKDKPNLGDVAGSLKGQSERWSFVLPGQNDKGVETLEAMLRLMWPNPDRHGGTGPIRKPSLEEAQAVVHLAVTLVQWLRSNALRLS